MVVEPFQFAPALPPNPAPSTDHHGEDVPGLVIQHRRRGIEIGEETERKGVERLWRSLKYECVYLQAFETGSQARTGIGGWIDYYNTSRPHSAFDGRTPEEVYSGRDAPSPGHALEMAPEALAASKSSWNST